MWLEGVAPYKHANVIEEWMHRPHKCTYNMLVLSFCGEWTFVLWPARHGHANNGGIDRTRRALHASVRRPYIAPFLCSYHMLVFIPDCHPIIKMSTVKAGMPSSFEAFVLLPCFHIPKFFILAVRVVRRQTNSLSIAFHSVMSKLPTGKAIVNDVLSGDTVVLMGQTPNQSPPEMYANIAP